MTAAPLRTPAPCHSRRRHDAHNFRSSGYAGGWAHCPGLPTSVVELFEDLSAFPPHAAVRLDGDCHYGRLELDITYRPEDGPDGTVWISG